MMVPWIDPFVSTRTPCDDLPWFPLLLSSPLRTHSSANASVNIHTITGGNGGGTSIQWYMIAFLVPLVFYDAILSENETRKVHFFETIQKRRVCFNHIWHVAKMLLTPQKTPILGRIPSHDLRSSPSTMKVLGGGWSDLGGREDRLRRIRCILILTLWIFPEFAFFSFYFC